MLVARPDGPTGAHGANAITIVTILKRKVTKKDFESVTDAGIRKISKILAKIVGLVQNSRVKEHYAVDINPKCAMKLSVKTAIIVLAIWNAFGRTGANGVPALQSVAMDIV